MILLLALFLILFESVPEALALKGHKTIAGTIEFIYRVVVTLILFAWITGVQWHIYLGNYYFIIGGYLLLRFAIFDIIYNLIAGLSLTFIGTTKLSDKLWQKFFALTHFPVGLFFGMLKFICFLIGLTWLISK